MYTRIKERLSLLFCLLCFNIFAQKNSFGSIPSLNLNKGFKNNWHLNLKIESRNLFNDNIDSEIDSWRYKYLHSDYAVLTSKKIGLNNALAAGILFRFRDQKIYRRYIQQFTLIKKYTSFRMAHRFSLDQTRAQKEPLAYRFRYRVTLELPLNGTSVDSKEWYLKINNEYLNLLEDQTYNLEFRVVPLVGFKFSDKNKLESGLDYRLESLIEGNKINKLWLSLNWYLIL